MISTVKCFSQPFSLGVCRNLGHFNTPKLVPFQIFNRTSYSRFDLFNLNCVDKRSYMVISDKNGVSGDLTFNNRTFMTYRSANINFNTNSSVNESLHPYFNKVFKRSFFKKRASDETEQNEESTSEEPDTPEKKEIADLKKNVLELKETIKELERKLLYSAAEMKTIQNRTNQQIEEAREYGASKFMKDIFEVSDILDNAVNMVPKEMFEEGTPSYGSDEVVEMQNAFKDFVLGIKMTQSILDKKFEQHGVKKDNPLGKPFDPNFHHVKYEVPYTEGGLPPTHVAEVMRVGFIYNKRVLRAAEVGVIKK